MAPAPSLLLSRYHRRIRHCSISGFYSALLYFRETETDLFLILNWRSITALDDVLNKSELAPIFRTP
jgi:hypothetical protein